MSFSVEPPALRKMSHLLYALTGDCTKASGYANDHVWENGSDLGELFSEVQSITDQVRANIVSLCQDMTMLVTSDGLELLGVADYYHDTDESVSERMDHKIHEVADSPGYYDNRTYPVDTVPAPADD